MKTKELNAKVYPYILDCIDAEGYDANPQTDADKLAFLCNTFASEYGWSIDRFGERRAFEEWIKGLPSSFGIEFADRDILRLAREWGSLDENATESREQKILDNYWNFITVKTFQLFKKHGVK